MNGITEKTEPLRSPSVAVLAAAGAILLWLSQPPIAAWPLAFVALVPSLKLVTQVNDLTRRGLWVIWLAGLVYWLVSLQGLRHAHPAIYGGWFALAAYLSVYGVLFVTISRRLLRAGRPLWLTAPVVWVGLECIRNYFATGISAAMLGHTLADVPVMIQIADMFGSYGVSFVIVAANVAVFSVVNPLLVRRFSRTTAELGIGIEWKSVVIAIVLVAASLIYGQYRLRQPSGEKQLATFALIQRSEVVEYVPDQGRAVEMFYDYARQSISALDGTSERVDAIIWPESMLSGGMFWVVDHETAVPPPQFDHSDEEFQQGLDFQRDEFLLRAADLQNAFAASNQGGLKPQLIGGCGLLRYAEDPQMFSGLIQIDTAGQVAAWYAKTHRVLLGEHIPILSSMPGVRDFIPLGLRLSRGPGPQRFSVADTNVSPNICIETAVERVAVNHLSQLHRTGGLPDVIVTVTNDGWFDDSSVIEHHLRCAQMVAVGCRRPILSSANNGPTAWIDSDGQIVQRLATGSEGAIVATPLQDNRVSIYVLIGDWPARILALTCIGVMVLMGYERRVARKSRQSETQ